MKRKALPLVMGLAASFLMMALPVQATTTNLYLDPPETVGPPPDIGETLTLTLRVDTVTHLVGWCVSIEWDPSKLKYVYWMEGDTLKYSGAYTYCIVEGMSPSKIDRLSCVTFPLTEVDVPSVPSNLANFTFRVLDYTCCLGTSINITFSQLDESTGGEIPHTVTDATFTLCRPPIYSCYADGTPTDQYWPNETIYVAISSAGSEDVTIKVVDDQPVWEPCMTPTDVTDDGPNNVPLSAGVNIVPLGTIPGAKPYDYYDIWVDLDNDCHYDECEPVDGIELQGFHIVSDLTSTLMGLGACFVALAAFVYKRRPKD